MEKIECKCKCGCGQLRPKYDKKGRKMDYIKGHYQKSKGGEKSSHYKKEIHTNEKIECACGCNQQRLKFDKRGRERKYIKGHLWKGKHPSEESKRKMRESRARQIIKHSEETKIKIRLGNIGKKRLEETKLKLSKSHKGKKFSEEHKRKIKESRAKQIFPLWDTSIEIKIQDFLKKLGVNFYTHHYVKEIIHAYQCDIFIPSMNLILECDGDYWHGNPKKFPNPNKMQLKQIEEDNIRTKELLEKGFRVIRLWENEIKEMSLENFKNKIKQFEEGLNETNNLDSSNTIIS